MNTNKTSTIMTTTQQVNALENDEQIKLMDELFNETGQPRDDDDVPNRAPRRQPPVAEEKWITHKKGHQVNILERIVGGRSHGELKYTKTGNVKYHRKPIEERTKLGCKSCGGDNHIMKTSRLCPNYDGAYRKAINRNRVEKGMEPLKLIAQFETTLEDGTVEVQNLGWADQQTDRTHAKKHGYRAVTDTMTRQPSMPTPPNSPPASINDRPTLIRKVSHEAAVGFVADVIDKVKLRAEVTAEVLTTLKSENMVMKMTGADVIECLETHQDTLAEALIVASRGMVFSDAINQYFKKKMPDFEPDFDEPDREFKKNVMMRIITDGQSKLSKHIPLNSARDKLIKVWNQVQTAFETSTVQ